jgi:patatin-like phospholipase/acyl hydrolase
MFRILSLDGGGIKGAFPAAVLATLDSSRLNAAPLTQ